MKKKPINKTSLSSFSLPCCFFCVCVRLSSSIHVQHWKTKRTEEMRANERERLISSVHFAFIYVSILNSQSSKPSGGLSTSFEHRSLSNYVSLCRSCTRCFWKRINNASVVVCTLFCSFSSYTFSDCCTSLLSSALLFTMRARECTMNDVDVKVVLGKRRKPCRRCNERNKSFKDEAKIGERTSCLLRDRHHATGEESFTRRCLCFRSK